MFSGSNTNEETVIAEGLKIEGKVTADGLVRIHGKVLGDVRCAALEISEKALIVGTVVAESIVVDGTVEGPIRGDDVVLQSRAHVTGDIQHKSLAIEKGAVFIGRSKQVDTDAKADKKAPAKSASAKGSSSSANDDKPTETSSGKAA